MSILDSEEESFVQNTDRPAPEKNTDILNLLEPHKEATNIMSRNTYPSLNMVVPAYAAIMNHLELLSSSNDVQLVCCSKTGLNIRILLFNHS